MRLTEEITMGRTYVGRRTGRAGTVQVYGPDGVKPLEDRWHDAARDFGWGTDFSGSVALARALLSDAFGVAATDALATTFAAEVVSRFPPGGFALGEEEVRGWRTPPAARTLSSAALVEHLGGIALSDDDDQAKFLDRMIDRCWDDQTLRQ